MWMCRAPALGNKCADQKEREREKEEQIMQDDGREEKEEAGQQQVWDRFCG